MNRLEFAARRFRQIVPAPVSEWVEVPVRDLRVWMTDEVCPVVEDYAHRPAFRSMAAWPLRTLVKGTRTAERELVEAVDTRLVESARSVLALARKQRVRKRIARQNPPQRMTTFEEVHISARRVRTTAREETVVDVLAAESAQVEAIAGRFWTDLVCAEDYFEPRGGWMLRSTGHAQAGEFVATLNPELHVVGDFVSRCLLRRVGVLRDLLARFSRKCRAAAAQVAGSYSGLIGREQEVWAALVESADALDRACFAGAAAPVRDSCVILTQTYAAFGRSPDLGWLGLDPAIIRAGAATVGHGLTHLRSPEMAERIAVALGDLRSLYDGGSPGQEAVEEAIAAGGLVLVEASRECHWEGRRVPVDWRRNRKLWALLRELASKAQRGAAVREHDLYPDSGTRSLMSTLVGRFRRKLPPSLRRLILPVRGERAYRLDLEGGRIHLLQ